MAGRKDTPADRLRREGPPVTEEGGHDAEEPITASSRTVGESIRTIPRRPGAQRLELPDDQIAAEFAAGKSENELARQYGVARATIGRRLTEMGVKPSATPAATVVDITERLLPGRRWSTRPALVASASRLNLNDGKSTKIVKGRRQAWQAEAFDYADEVGEINFATNFMANLMAKIRLFPAIQLDPKAPPVPIDSEDAIKIVGAEASAMAAEILGRLKALQGGQAAILHDMSINFDIAGEFYLHGHTETEDEDWDDPDSGATDGSDFEGDEDWQVRSIDELVVEGDKFALRTGVGAQSTQEIPAGDLCIRLWNRHPRLSFLATSPMRPLLGPCETLLLLEREQRAHAMSHLNAGAFIVPLECSFGPTDPTRDQSDGESRDDPLDADLDEIFITPIQEPGSAGSVAPFAMRPAAQYADLIRWIDMARPDNQYLDQRIENIIMRIARGLNVPVEVVTGLMQCVDIETEVLSARGWLRYDQVESNDEILTLNHVTGVSEWQRVEKASRFNVSGHPMVSFEGANHSSLSTPDHRWPVLSGRGKRRWVQSQEMKGHHRLLRSAPHAGFPTEAKYSDAFVELVAWFWTEGSYHKGTAGGTISQSERANPEKVIRLRSMLMALCGPASDSLHSSSRPWIKCSFEGCEWPCHQWGLCMSHRAQKARGVPLRPVRRISGSVPPEMKQTWQAWREPPGPKDTVRFALNKAIVDELRTIMDDHKVVSPDFIRSLTRSQLELFIDASVQADGHWDASGGLVLRQVVEARTDAFELACILSGRGVKRWERDVRDGYSPADHPSHQYAVAAGLGRSMRVHEMTSEIRSYTGTVWCPTVPNGTWLARRHGSVYFTGNSTFSNASQVKRNVNADHLEPRCILTCDCVTAGFFQWQMIEAGIPKDIARQIFVWFDMSAALTEEDQAEAALNANKQLLISDQAARKLLGYSDGDAPSPDEMLLRIVLNSPRLDPFILSQILVRAGLFPDLRIAAPPVGVLDEHESVSEMPAPAASVNSDGTEIPPPVAAPAVAPAPVAASANPNPDAAKWKALGPKLAAVDRDLRTKTLGALDRAMAVALKAAGNRVKSKVRDRSTEAKLLASVPDPGLYAAKLGEALVAAAGLSNDALVGDGFDAAMADVKSWIDAAYTRAVELLGTVVQVPYAKRSELDIAHAANTAKAVEFLKGQLVALASQRLYDPTVAGDTRGESDPNARVPAGLVRAALAIAGGTTPQLRSLTAALDPGDEVQLRPEGITLPSDGVWFGVPGAITDGNGDPVGGVGTGPDVMAAIADGGGSVEGYVWSHGSPARSFPPHEDLDGVFASDFDDPAWANPTGWPSDQAMPGDHDGCFPKGVLVGGPEVTGTVVRHYDGEMVELAFASGVSLPLTPNHPVLVMADGVNRWVAAGQVNIGDEVLRRGMDGAALIEGVVESFEAAPVTVPVDPVNFHGDGAGSTLATVRSLARGEVHLTMISGEHDKVTGIDRFHFAGSVYNLETVPHWYEANGVVVANCLCDVVPSIQGPDGTITPDTGQ